MGTAKILVVGAIQGRLKSAFGKIAKLQAKQSFSFAIIVGDLFAKDEVAEFDDELESLLKGEIEIPLTVYFSVGDEKLPGKVAERLENSDELVSNLIYAGRKGTFNTHEGIRIITVGGRLVESEGSLTQALNKTDPLFLAQDAKSLGGAHSAHILITNQWPANITRLSTIDVPEGSDSKSEAQCLAELNQKLKPWYHFSSSPSGMWEREVLKQPEVYNSLEEAKFTRFKSLASVEHSVKEWVSAFSLDTTRAPPAEKWTEMPFLNGSPPRKRARLEDQQQAYDRQNGHQGGRGRNKRNRANNWSSDGCFMCMKETDFRNHLAVSIAEETWLSVVRGPLPEASTFPQLPYSGHTLIVPMYHAADERVQGQRAIGAIQTEFNEMTQYRKALNRMIGSISNGELGAVCYEVNRIGIRHFHWQHMSIQADKIRRGLIEAAFKLAAKNNKYNEFKPCQPDEMLEERHNFFRVWIWTPTSNPVERADEEANGGEGDGGQTTSMYFHIPEEGQRFNVAFGREVMAGLLQLEDRVDWKQAILRDEAAELKVEEAEALNFKKTFKKFDFATTLLNEDEEGEEEMEGAPVEEAPAN